MNPEVLEGSTEGVATVAGGQLLEQCFQQPYYSVTNFATESFGTETHEHISLSDVTTNLARRHLQEIKQTVDQIVPKTHSVAALRRTLRELYSRESAHLFEFFHQPISSISAVQTAIHLLRRFGRSDYSAKAVKIKDLCLDVCVESALEGLNAKLAAAAATDLSGCIHQWQILTDSWKTASSEMLKAQGRLETAVNNLQSLQKKISDILLLPTNDEYGAILDATEKYLRRAFEENKIEDAYKEFIENCKTLYCLQDLIASFRFLVNAQTEPICSVCLTEPVSMTTVPCGHTFCQTCGQRQTMTCYICRSTVSQKIKIFFS